MGCCCCKEKEVPKHSELKEQEKKEVKAEEAHPLLLTIHDDVNLLPPEFKEVQPPGSRRPMILNELTHDIKGDYDFKDMLGEPGAFGTTYAAETGQEVAVKVINKYRRTYVELNAFRREVSVLMHTKQHPHENLIDFIDVYEDDENVFIVMEIANGGELFEAISAKKRISEADAQLILKQILRGVKHLHDMRLAHCDLKPSNILFASAAADSHVKIIDFGMAQFWNVRTRHYLTGKAGTVYYQSPELIHRKYNLATDMWSVGVIAFVMMEGFPPFYGKSNKEVRHRVLGGFCPQVKQGPGPWFPVERPISAVAQDFISKLLDMNVATRMTADEALNHPFIAGDVSTAPLSPLVLESLTTFKARCVFQQAALQKVIDLLAEQDIEVLQKTFKEMDTNHDDTITFEEFKDAVEKKEWAKERRLSEEDIHTMFENTDIDSDGRICYTELLLALTEKKLVAKEERLRIAFYKMDLNFDGMITENELAKALDISVKDARTMMQDVDSNHDGLVDYEEFLDVWRTTNSPF